MDLILKNGTTAYNVKNRDLPELEKLGLVDETTKSLNSESEKKCALCGKPYEGYGNSTWGYWELHGCTKQEDEEYGESRRCCDKCNRYQVVTARLKLAGML